MKLCKKGLKAGKRALIDAAEYCTSKEEREAMFNSSLPYWDNVTEAVIQAYEANKAVDVAKVAKAIKEVPIDSFTATGAVNVELSQEFAEKLARTAINAMQPATKESGE